MEIKIKGEHLSVTEAIANHIKDKFSHLPHPDKMQHAEFRLGIDKNAKERSQYVHFLGRCPKEEFFIKSQDANLYVAIDKLMKKLHRSFTKSKELHKTHIMKDTPHVPIKA